MIKIDIKPLSVNDAWKGRRFKTDEYKVFQYRLKSKLKKLNIPKGSLVVVYEFGFSSKLSDWDNPIKPLQDILQLKYGFNDSRIEMGIGKKYLVPIGEEYLKYGIYEYRDNLFESILKQIER